jgi:NTP pyrophosphatase (non-canonical NTP hydrolase)
MIDERLRKIADHYGLYDQLSMLQEECAELIQASSKYKRRKLIDDYQHIVEEIADVEIMIAQVKYLLKMPNYHVDSVKEEKIKRQLERIQNESQ